MPKPTNVRQTISIPADEDNAEANPANTLVASDSRQAMRRPRLSASAAHKSAPKIIPSIHV